MQNTISILIAVAAIWLFAGSTLEAQIQTRSGRVVYRTNNTGLKIGPKRNSHTGWYPYVVARQGDRQWIQETPIELRPNRPLHFWGNSRRRQARR